MSKKTEVSLISSQITGLLGIAFIVLKLTGVIDWSWWLVTAPFWGGFAIVLLLIVCAILFPVVIIGFYKLFQSRKW